MDGKNATYASGVALATSVASFVYLNNEIKTLKEEMDKLKQGLFRTSHVISQGNAQTVPVIKGLQSKMTEVEQKLEYNQMMMDKGTIPKNTYVRKTAKKTPEPTSVTVIKEEGEDDEQAIISRIKGGSE